MSYWCTEQCGCIKLDVCSQTEKATQSWDSTDLTFWKRKSLGPGNKSVIVRCWGGEAAWKDVCLAQLFCILVVLVITQLESFVKTHSTIHQKNINFTVCSFKNKKAYLWGFLGSPVVRTLCFHCQGHWFSPWYNPLQAI